MFNGFKILVSVRFCRNLVTSYADQIEEDLFLVQNEGAGTFTIPLKMISVSITGQVRLSVSHRHRHLSDTPQKKFRI